MASLNPHPKQSISVHFDRRGRGGLRWLMENWWNQNEPDQMWHVVTSTLSSFSSTLPRLFILISKWMLRTSRPLTHVAFVAPPPNLRIAIELAMWNVLVTKIIISTPFIRGWTIILILRSRRYYRNARRSRHRLYWIYSIHRKQIQIMSFNRRFSGNQRL